MILRVDPAMARDHPIHFFPSCVCAICAYLETSVCMLSSLLFDPSLYICITQYADIVFRDFGAGFGGGRGIGSHRDLWQAPALYGEFSCVKGGLG